MVKNNGFKQEVKDILSWSDTVTIEFKNNAGNYDFCEICSSGHYAGLDDEEGYICDYIGNVLYNSIDGVVSEVFAYLNKIGAYITDVHE